jgi:hypothetical protein
MMGEPELRLDGNAIAGDLESLFGRDVTTARGQCNSCKDVAVIGTQHLYMHPLAPGAALRCHSCENLLIVLTKAPGRIRLGLPGLVWLEFGEDVPLERQSTDHVR